MGMTLRRLTAKVLIRPGSGIIGENLRPHQLGYGTRGGCEAAAHSARHLLEKTTEPIVFLKLDIKNAFNTIHRSALNIVRQNMPDTYRFFYSAYAEPSILFFGKETISSTNGVQQGDPGAPAIFSLGIHQAVERVRSRFNTWYLDDASLADTPETVLADVVTLIPMLRSLGLELNGGKCELTFINSTQNDETLRSFQQVLPNIRVVDHKDSSLLGSPLSEGGLISAMTESTKVLSHMSCRLKIIDPHQAFTLLRSAFAIPKILFILRSSPAYRHPDILRAWDTVLQTAFASITNVAALDDTWTQATLPVSLGGLGLRRAEDVALPAYLSSTTASSGLTQLILAPFSVAELDTRGAVEEWRSRVDPSALTPTNLNAHRQKDWDTPIIHKGHSPVPC